MNGKRFSDVELHAMHKDLADLKDQFFLHEQGEAKKFSEMIEAIHNNTESITMLVNETKMSRRFSRDIQGAASIGKSVQALFSWLIKLGVLGLAVTKAIEWGLHYFEK